MSNVGYLQHSKVINSSAASCGASDTEVSRLPLEKLLAEFFYLLLPCRIFSTIQARIKCFYFAVSVTPLPLPIVF